MERGEALAIEVGTRIGDLRRRRGWSMSEMARRAGLGKATLSELEAGRRNPTLETLYAVTSAMGLPLSAVIPGPAAEHSGQTGTGRPAQAGQAGDDLASSGPVLSGRAVDAVLLERFDDTSMVTEVYRVRVRAGIRHVSAAHGPGVREYLTVYAGVAEVGDPAGPLVIPAGRHGSWDASAPHLYAAQDEPVEGTLLVRYPA